ncbi:hypothetical protein OG948_60480 (plasmid) [Embleya sp. NBC_00888]|uniref:hypothetical protein n=1 Tax=Embleya sp. NBC_00888 TaxID=2975960 RepID=UPI002F90E84C|nr:hypothetical protein OG948_60480 [Embleya sp. NBC_00888]
MPIFLDQPGYGDRGPDGLGWNRLSLNAHFDRRHQCGWQPTDFPTLFESMTGRQRWGGYERCHRLAPGWCGQCPVQARVLAREGGLEWPPGVAVFLARVRPLPPTPGAMWADPASGRSTLDLYAWPDERTAIPATWQEVRRTPGVRIGWAWHDDDGQAFWLTRDNPAAATAVVRERRLGAGTRHALYETSEGPRLALVICPGPCDHDAHHLRHLAADLAVCPSGIVGPVFPERLPGLRGVTFAYEDGRGVLCRNGRVTTVSWGVPLRRSAAAALVAYAVRLAAAA